MKLLIVYGSRYGWTKKTASILTEILENEYTHEVVLTDYKISKEVKKNIPNFDLVIAGSSITAGRWKSGIKRFLKRNRNSFRHLAIYVSAGGTMQSIKEGKRTKQEALQKAINQYIDPVKQKFQLTSVSDMAFGGQYGKEPKIRYNSWDEGDIETWAKQLHRQLSGF